MLGVLDYIQAHWAIDLDRVHLMGGSMGGGGTFWMGSRYPQRFASGRPVCGYASDLPVGNLLTFPLYATHSDDDFTVPVLHSRGPMARLRELGGNATLDETTGLGHAAWDYKAGNERSEAWYVRQVRAASNSIKQLTFTALDGEARRDYWAEIAEWGQKPEPASIALRVTGKNQISARLDNVTRLTLRVSEAPLDPKAALTLNISGVPLVRPAPLPAVLTVVKQNGGWVFEDQAPALPFRLHTPGGANQLYNGEPLLIVYGTSRGADVTLALRTAAAVASRSASAAWPSPNGEVGDDGISHNQNLYGELRIKADVDVSADEIATHHLVLIGTAEQNQLVARLAERLPVRYGQTELRFTDGTKEAAADTAIGLCRLQPARSEPPDLLGRVQRSGGVPRRRPHPATARYVPDRRRLRGDARVDADAGDGAQLRQPLELGEPRGLRTPAARERRRRPLREHARGVRSPGVQSRLRAGAAYRLQWSVVRDVRPVRAPHGF